MEIKESYIRKKIILSKEEMKNWQDKYREIAGADYNFIDVWETIQINPRNLTYEVYSSYRQYNNLKRYGFIK